MRDAVRCEIEIDLLKEKIRHIQKNPPYIRYYKLQWIAKKNTRRLIGPFINNPVHLKYPTQGHKNHAPKKEIIWEHTFTDDERSKLNGKT